MYLSSLWPIFDRLHPLPAASHEALEALASPVLVAKGGLLQPVGHSCRTLYFLATGIARIFYYRDGHDITEAFETNGALVVRADQEFEVAVGGLKLAPSNGISENSGKACVFSQCGQARQCLDKAIYFNSSKINFTTFRLCFLGPWILLLLAPT